jgi:cytosine/adenosine deaminase-related metal-dependent hydrolase
MVRRVLYNTTLLEGDDLEITYGYLIVKDNKIEKIGEGMPHARDIDLKRGFVLPPFVNVHTHLADAVAKEIYLGKSQPQVVGPRGAKFRELKRAGRELVSTLRATIHDVFKGGTLAHCDFREGGLAGVKILKRASTPPVRSVILGRPSKLSELDELVRACDGVGLPSLDVFEPSVLKEIARNVRRAGKIFSVHVAETEEAQRLSFEKTGKGEVERALELRPSFIIHSTWASVDDLLLLKKARVPTVFCARANSLLGVGTPPILKALKAGVKFCIGTDNVAVCQPDMFGELSFDWASLRREDSRVGNEEARELLRAATIEPLNIFNLPWRALQEGAPATFLVLSRGYNLVGLKNVHAGLVNRARVDNVRAIFINGKGFKLGS